MFKLLFKVPGGHRYFEDENGRVAVADDSGDDPSTTDDGPLYVVRTEPVRFGRFATIAVEDEQGERNSVCESAEDGLVVADRLGLPVNARNVNYRLVAISET